MSDLYLAAAASAAAMLASFWLIMFLGWLTETLFQKIMPVWLKVILTILVWAGACAGGYYWQLTRIQKADESAKAGFVSEEYVTVHETDYGWFFDGWGTENAAVFYGEKGIEEDAYAPLLKAVARQGTDCFLYKMPYADPARQYDAYSEIIAHHDWYRWFMMCHGSGSEAGSKYFAEHSGDFAGMITLGTYPMTDLKRTQLLITVVADKDPLMDTAAYEETLKKTKAKTRENTIRGGSHYGWAACGTVKGDGQAEITPALQQVLTAQLIRQTLIRE